MVTLVSSDNEVVVRVDGRHLGSIHLSDNPYHKQNCYIKLSIECLDTAISAELFEKVVQLTQRPLQAMVSSDNARITDFLMAGGFVCKRKCYEVEAGKDDYIGTAPQTALLHAHAGEKAYARCCKVMYEHYIEIHKAINPWTAELADFCNNLPSEVIYETDCDKVVNLAFVEDNEIAYICGSDESRFAGFAASLVNELFLKHDTVCFESDDCDWAAMRLKSMFANQEETSFDTYIYASGGADECHD